LTAKWLTHQHGRAEPVWLDQWCAVWEIDPNSAAVGVAQPAPCIVALFMTDSCYCYGTEERLLYHINRVDNSFSLPIAPK
jgi:hypothetical protein